MFDKEMDEKLNATPKKKQGFASLSPERRREIARKGGKSVPAEKRSFSQNAELASSAGAKGGKSVNPRKRSFSQDHALASRAGKAGGAMGKGRKRGE
jgi:general stress protein YciG